MLIQSTYLVVFLQHGSLMSVTCDVTFCFEITSSCRPKLINVLYLLKLLIIWLVFAADITRALIG